ncbi:MAG: hypothetical protein H6553_06940 [Chitinophagales bacterium]|nr:hypothetical protein [Chitinophagales bacterium]
MQNENSNNKTLAPWYDPNNPNLYKKMTEKEVFEWLSQHNAFIWAAMTPEQREQQKELKIKSLYKNN